MHIFITGATGFIGKALIPELLSAGHTLTGLARSDASAELLTSLGVTPHRGSLTDLDALKAAAAAADAVIHLAFIHDFANFTASAEIDKQAIAAMGDALQGTGKPLLMTSGTLLLRHGIVGTEEHAYDPSSKPFDIRGQSEELAKQLAREKGVRALVVRMAPVVHGDGDKMFVYNLVTAAREHGVSAYIGDGENHWPATHVRDAAVAFRLAVEREVPAGSTLHFVAEEGVKVKDIAAAVGGKLGVPVVSRTPEEAVGLFGWFANVVGIDNPVSSKWTKEVLGWEPVERGVVDDVEDGKYFD